jgi:hypothetical protein
MYHNIGKGLKKGLNRSKILRGIFFSLLNPFCSENSTREWGNPSIREFVKNNLPISINL